MAAPVIQFEDVEIDLARYEVRRKGRRVHLEKQPFDLLVLLVRNRGNLVPRKEIAESLWGSNVFVETDRSINNAIRKIRLALGDDPERPRFIETVPGRGYRFTANVSFSSENHAERITQQAVPRDGHHADSDSTGSQSARGLEVDLSRLSLLEPAPVLAVASHRKRWQIAAVLASFGAIALAISLVLVKWKDRLPFTPKVQIGSLAVLPLANLSGDPSQEYFVDGMTEELTNELAQVSALRVTSRTSVMVYKNARKPLPQIARELNVDAIVEGSVLRSGNQVRISAQLIQAAGDRHLWGQSYDRDLNDVLGLQKEVAREIARQIHAKLTPQEVAPTAHPTVNSEAHDAYLQGRYHANKQTEKELQTAIEYFRRAISRDPSFAPAYTGLADCYLSLATAYRAPREVMPSAKASALRALELNDSLSEAHSSLGSVYFYYDWDWPATEREAKRALALNASNASAHDLYGDYLIAMGRTEDGVAELQRAYQLDPFSLFIMGDRVLWLFMARKYDAAIDAGRKAIETEPNNASARAPLALAYAQTGRFREAMAEADAAYRLDNSPLMASYRAGVYASAGRSAEAKKMLDQINEMTKKRYSCSYEVAAIHVALGQNDRAFEWFERAREARSDCMPNLNVDPRLDSLRADPRFLNLLRSLGFAK